MGADPFICSRWGQDLSLDKPKYAVEMSEFTYRVLFLLIYGTFAAIRIRYRVSTGGEDESKRGIGLTGLLLSLIILAMFASIFLYLVSHSWMDGLQLGYPEYVRWIGAGISIIQLPLVIWIHRILGRQYAARLRIVQGHRLVVEGPYRMIRHPMYVVLWAFGFSVSLITANAPLLVFSFIIIFPLYLIAMGEEEMLLERFGDEYRVYMERTGRFFPRIR